MIEPKTLFEQIVACGFTHVIWVPDNVTGKLESFFATQDAPQLIRVCREGEGIAVAAGLLIGGKHPLVIIQSTGLFEAGDALRNVVYDMKLPLFMIVGYRGYETWKSNPHHVDSARDFAEPILKGWKLDYTLVETQHDLKKINRMYRQTQTTGEAAVILLSEP